MDEQPFFTGSEGLPQSPLSEPPRLALQSREVPLSPTHPDRPEGTPDLEAWTPQTLTKLLFLSFRHSQGSPGLQDSIFTYVRFRYGEQVIPDAWERLVKSDVRSAIRSYLQVDKGKPSAVAFHQTVSSHLVASEVKRAFASLKAAVEEPEPFDYRIVATITTSMLFRELMYFIQRNGRPRGETTGGDPFHADRFFSYLNYYAIQGHPTGLVVLDTLYRDMAAYIYQSRTRAVTDTEEYLSLLGNELLAKLDAIVQGDIAKVRER